MEAITSFFRFYFYYLDALFTGFSVVTRVAVAFVMLMAIIILFTIYKLIYAVYKIKQQKKRKKKVQNLYEEKTREIIFSAQTLPEETIRHELKVAENASFKDWESRYITDLLLSIKDEKNESAINVENYSTVIRVFLLVGFWDSHLHKRNLKKNKRALRRLISINNTIPEGIFTHLIHTNNHDLRKLAKCGYMQFSAHNPLKFLDEDFDQRFNSLDEVRIHAALRSREKELPSLIRWVYNTENEAYKCFLIEEIGLFNQIECIPQLLNLFKETKSEQIKMATAKTLGRLKHPDTIDILVSEYELCSEAVQSSIIDAMGKIGTQEALEFLEEECYRTINNELFIKIVRNIYMLDSTQRIYPRLKQNTHNSFQKTVFEHIEQIEISNAI